MKITATIVLAVVIATLSIEARAEDTCNLNIADRARAAVAFDQMLSVFRHPRCANCHGALNVYEADTAHPPGSMMQTETDIFGDTMSTPAGAETCVQCHDAARGEWIQKPNPTSEIQWANLSDEDLWRRLRNTRIITNRVTRETEDSTGNLLIQHTRDDPLIQHGFAGTRAMTANTSWWGERPSPEPPPFTKEEFIVALEDWVDALDARETWPEGDCSVALAERQFSIRSLQYPETIASGARAIDLTVVYSGRPEFPIQVILQPRTCPSDSSCGTERRNVSETSSANTITGTGMFWCTGLSASEVWDMDYEVVLMDAQQRRTEPFASPVTCKPPEMRTR